MIGDAHSVQWILHLGLGDDLAMIDEQGNPISLRIVGTFAESIFRSELLMSEENLLAHFPGQSGYSTFLVEVAGGSSQMATRSGDGVAGDAATGDSVGVTGEAPAQERGSLDARIDAISAALERNLGPWGFDAERTDEKLAGYLVVQNTYLSTFQLLGGLGLLLGTVGWNVPTGQNETVVLIDGRSTAPSAPKASMHS